jgi:hypothetical protein
VQFNKLNVWRQVVDRENPTATNRDQWDAREDRTKTHVDNGGLGGDTVNDNVSALSLGLFAGWTIGHGCSIFSEGCPFGNFYRHFNLSQIAELQSIVWSGSNP